MRADHLENGDRHLLRVFADSVGRRNAPDGARCRFGLMSYGHRTIARGPHGRDMWDVVARTAW